MATSVTTAPDLVAARAQRRAFASRMRSAPAALVAVLTLYAVAVHGFHPYAEDGGLYLAGVKHLLDPAIFPANLSFVSAHLHYSLFAWVVAATVRLTGLSLDLVVGCGYVACTGATLGAASLLVSRCFRSRSEQTAALLVFAAVLPIPVAGTSLLMVDPYLTARSVSTPAVLLLLAGVLRLRDDGGGAERGRAWAMTATGAAVAIAFHPLMAGYGIVVAVLLLASEDAGARGIGSCWRRPPALALLLCGGAVIGAALLTWTAPGESAAYREVALTHPSWFLSAWRWYEMLGLLGPVAVLAGFWRSGRMRAQRALGRAGVGACLAATAVALLFARTDAANFAVARVQPMRVLQPVYCVVFLLLGGLLGRVVLGGRPWRNGASAAVLGAVLFFSARATYPGSPHLETGWARGSPEAQGNPWVQAFLWTQQNTPRDAVFALDADYITRPGEDAQGFRAIAERSVLPDTAKDGGEASITPALAESWSAGERAQEALSGIADAERVRRLRPLGVSWIVLERQSATAFACPYSNGAVRICRLP